MASNTNNNRAADMRDRINAMADRLVRPSVNVLGSQWPSYRFCVYVGASMGIAIGVVAASLTELRLAVMIVVLTAGVLASLALAFGTRIVRGHEQFTFYHYQFAIVAAGMIVLWVAGVPFLPYLDVLSLSLGATLAIGRLGCLLAGCCHGRPYGWGVCYRKTHAANGFPSYLTGVRLFPIQGVESLWITLVTAITFRLWREGAAPGEVLSWFFVAQAAGRFSLEFARGDWDRLYIFGFNEVQWTSVLLVSAVASAEWLGAIPLRALHPAMLLLMFGAMVAASLHRRLSDVLRRGLRDPLCVKELAEALERLKRSAPEMGGSAHGAREMVAGGCAMGVSTLPTVTTSLGIRLSASTLRLGSASIQHISFSATPSRDLTEKTARLLAQQIVRLGRLPAPGELVKGEHGVFHLLTPQPTTS